MPVGRPPMWDDPEAFDKAVDEYFEKEKDGATWTGLALHLGFSSRDSLNDYAKKPEYSDSVKKGLLRIESKYEKAMMKQPAGAIFALKNFGWKDKQEVEQSGGLTIKFEDPGSYVYPSQDQGDSGIPESL